MAHFDQPCSDTCNVVDSYTRTVAYIKNISESGLVPTTSLYPSNTLLPGGSTSIYDLCGILSTKELSDSFSSGDVIGPYEIGKGLQDSMGVSDGLINNVVKYLEESGMLPELNLYPNNILFPAGAVQIDDIATFGFYRLLADSFSTSDIISSFGVGKYFNESMSIFDIDSKLFNKYINENVLNIDDVQGFGFYSWLVDNCGISDTINNTAGKNLDENINILDIILFGISLYLEENPNILDEISKYGYKSLTDNFTIEDNIVRNITQVLSEYTVIDDNIETVLRTLVRATLRSIKIDQSTLRAI